MAVNQSSYFSNAIVGQMQAGSDIDLYKIDATPQFAIGTGFTRQDGAKFRYGYVSTAVNRGTILAQDYSGSSIVDTDNIIIAPASAVAVANETIKPGDVGSHYVELTLATTTADAFAGGYFSVTDDTGEGYTYRIRGNTATDTPASGNIRLQLYDKIQVALTATTDCAITGNLYGNLIVAGTATDGIAAGVACASLTATAPFGWIQTAGIATVLCDTAGTAAQMAAVSQSVAGSYAPAHATGTSIDAYPPIGIIVTPGDTTGHGVINLRLE